MMIWVSSEMDDDIRFVIQFNLPHSSHIIFLSILCTNNIIVGLFPKECLDTFDGVVIDLGC
ncbi:hypothetical protein D3C84_981830 [compost metagenome]